MMHLPGDVATDSRLGHFIPVINPDSLSHLIAICQSDLGNASVEIRSSQLNLDCVMLTLKLTRAYIITVYDLFIECIQLIQCIIFDYLKYNNMNSVGSKTNNKSMRYTPHS